MEKAVILSAPILIEDGCYCTGILTHEETIAWVKKFNPTNFCGHQTVKIIGLEPANARHDCDGYERALIIQPIKRLEFGREYSAEEILEIGCVYRVISKMPPLN